MNLTDARSEQKLRNKPKSQNPHMFRKKIAMVADIIVGILGSSMIQVKSQGLVMFNASQSKMR
ncbi:MULTISPECIES: hypothetical protein [unclassified Paenibacillus]|uniref:hypothetical protein n=1 Tax=unclassified Paenibacillus TaxID=185978 RepID=UPI000413F82B|nr:MULTISPECIES: hypothetical protein [unclassified Paenibacillus]KGP79796.1 hypothetical protein P364_0122510 [Paenibacillus sp. MAEPY2]KGP83253.1 hypothetical protein P363_0124995 [Paenibacillus sp. MAEPY1]OZQ71737.1 hypothetical protein CA599_08890 [Paenibacillus taichungensis]HBU80697.1 hypothetical protein [Paenibacillus sp.]